MTTVERYVHVIWCDDIRQEVGNKPSFMGVYTGGLVLPELPCVLPKLCAWVLLSAPASQPLQGVSVKLRFDDGSALMEVPEFSPPAVHEVSDQQHLTRQNVMFGITLSPLPIPVNCKFIEPIVVVGGEDLPGPKLSIQVQSDMGVVTSQ